MAQVSLIPGTDTLIDPLTASVDGFIEPEWKLRAAMGESEVENGVKIHDHRVALPIKLKLTGLVDSIRSSGDRAVDCWKQVRELHETGAILRFVSEFGVINECAIINASTTIATRGLEFMLELQEINRIGLGPDAPLAAAATDPNNPAANRQPLVETGTKAPQALEPEVPVVIGADGVAREDVLGGAGRSDTIEIVDADGNATGRYTLKPPEEPETE